MEYIIYSDESEKRGRYYSNFYGGTLVRSPDLPEVDGTLAELKQELFGHSEAKWTKVTESYLQRYVKLIRRYFTFVREGKLKVRVMFTQNLNVPMGLSKEQVRAEYNLLYYQFIKHAFGLRYIDEPGDRHSVRLYVDDLPVNAEQKDTFKSCISGLSMNAKFSSRGVVFLKDQIAEVDSHRHVIMQCNDLVLGAMPFRLNKRHLERVDGHRGGRTVAKEALYREIAAQIREIRPGFNIGISTGVGLGGLAARWKDPYRHWLFVPKNSERKK